MNVVWGGTSPELCEALVATLPIVINNKALRGPTLFTIGIMRWKNCQHSQFLLLRLFKGLCQERKTLFINNSLLRVFF